MDELQKFVQHGIEAQKAVDERTSEASIPIAPEYRELHEIYCRCAEIREGLLRRGARHPGSRLFVELLRSYNNLSSAAETALALVQHGHDEPEVLATWREVLQEKRG